MKNPLQSTLQSIGAFASISGILLMLFNLNIAVQGLNIFLLSFQGVAPLAIPGLSMSGAIVSGGFLGFLAPFEGLIFFLLGLSLFAGGIYSLNRASI